MNGAEAERRGGGGGGFAPAGEGRLRPLGRKVLGWAPGQVLLQTGAPRAAWSQWVICSDGIFKISFPCGWNDRVSKTGMEEPSGAGEKESGAGDGRGRRVPRG